MQREWMNDERIWLITTQWLTIDCLAATNVTSNNSSSVAEEMKKARWAIFLAESRSFFRPLWFCCDFVLFCSNHQYYLVSRRLPPFKWSSSLVGQQWHISGGWELTLFDRIAGASAATHIHKLSHTHTHHRNCPTPHPAPSESRPPTPHISQGWTTMTWLVISNNYQVLQLIWMTLDECLHRIQ